MTEESEDQNTEDKLIKIEARLLEQEHRPIQLILNFLKRSKYQKNDPRRKAVTRAVIWRLFFSPTTLAVASSGILAIATVYFLSKQNDILDAQTTLVEQQVEILGSQNNMIDQQIHIAEATRRSSQMIILDGILRDINIELNTGKKELSSNLTARIISLSHSIKPYKFFDYQIDSISKLLSPERSQLLYSISYNDLENSYVSNQLFKKTNFEYADLDRLDLKNKKLNNVNLRYASLKKTLLHKAELKKAILREAYIVNAGFPNAIMNGIDLRNTYLEDVNLSGAILTKANLENTIFKNLDLSKIDSLDNVRVGRYNWFQYVKDSMIAVKGVDELMKTYRVDSVYYSSMKKKLPTLVRKEQQ
ncbi:pentapeptide repeat-containing protein [uncultured Kordia sp.]|uniref:pentapeptide repeat-containing protein n=1 Tax=uncultured Kordia sp. TaxID=507699 RepID=UPI00261A79C9|nr:pentapeptide repeat-containing protein [uncultured Kordia sp.]